jgi:hypothetical protein
MVRSLSGKNYPLKKPSRKDNFLVRRIKFITGLFLCLIYFIPVKAQILDTISYSLKQKPKFYLTLASFNTFIDGDYANIFRVKMGLSYNQRVKLGLGYSNLANNDVVTEIKIKGANSEFTTNGRLIYWNIGLSAEYFFYDNYPWQFSLAPFNVAFGKANYEYINRTDHKLTSTPAELVISYQPEISAQYSIFRWLGLGVTTGYRFTLLRSRKATQNLNAPLFAIDIRFFVDEVYKALFETGEK